MTSCSSLTCKDDNDTNDIHVEKQKLQSKQQRQYSGSQPILDDLSTKGSMNILEDVVRCLLEKDTSALGFQIVQRSDGICISYVEPNGPADRSGNIFVGDKIKELTIAFENMPISDALTILSCASTYKIRLELERAIINDAAQSDCPETIEHADTSSNSIQQFSTLCKSYSTSDLVLRLQKAQMFDKAVSGGSFMSKQKYQLPRQTVINTIKEEPPSTPEIPVTLASSNPSSDSTEKTESIPVMMGSVISEETIVINDPLPILRSLRTSPNEISPQPQNSPCVITSETYPKSDSTSKPTNILRQQSTPQIPSSYNEQPLLPLIPQENHKVDEINCNGFSEFVERSHYIYSNANIKDGIKKKCVEFCELIEPKRGSIVIEFEEDQGGDDCCQQSDEEIINLPNCIGTFDEAKNNLHQANSNINNAASVKIPPIVDDGSNSQIIYANYVEKDTVSGNTLNVTNVERNISHHSVGKIEASDDHTSRAGVIESKSGNDTRFSNNPEQVADIIPSLIPSHTEVNELNGKQMMESITPIVASPTIPQMTISDDTLSSENNQRSKCSQLKKLSGNYGINEVNEGKEVRKVNGTANDLKDESNNRSSIPQRSAKWSPKLQSHIPIVTRTPSTKSKRKLSKAEDTKVMSNSARSKVIDDTLKNDMNGASLYIAKKEALRKTYLPFSKINKSEEVDLNKERKARLEANQALLQRQQEELRTLGILP
ncbi:hypothetical protein LOAG_17695 [Loa loa]|uniref:PDZ domain-containing protein n=1 Tax=Loa loa TaxID=7209 RepID=A0A1S0UI12_LOALO|nr:hypothetical protein LOAG_17695 [Loa loa]EJD75101.1 hypothetical protein LOAG_17695 [Loa loa]